MSGARARVGRWVAIHRHMVRLARAARPTRPRLEVGCVTVSSSGEALGVEFDT
jgi:hypothetical protein